MLLYCINILTITDVKILLCMGISTKRKVGDVHLEVRMLL